MWAWEEIDDRINDLCNIAFSEDFSFCISTPEHDEDEIFYKSSITSKRFPFLSDDLDTKGIPCSSPIMIKNTNQSVNSSKCLNFHKALIARKSTPYLGDGIFVNKRRKSFPIVIKNTKRYCVKASTPLNPHKALDRTRNYLETQVREIQGRFTMLSFLKTHFNGLV